MYGAILGDVIGSRFEFDRGGKTKEFELFTDEDQFTDDTVMTIAVGEGLLAAGKDATDEEIMASVTASMQKWGAKYPRAGYGARFIHWLRERNPQPYGSYGNGSAMRVSAAGWLYDSLERTRQVAYLTAVVSHNHPEGLKGAECTAAVIFLARTGVSKEVIRDYVVEEFGYDLSESLAQLRARHEHIESCQDSLPKALVSFFEGESYEDVVRNAVSLGGDTDTLAAIAGAMAEAFYGIPVFILSQGESYLTEDMIQVLQDFDVALGRVEREEDDMYADNVYIKMAVDQIYKTGEQEAYAVLLNVLMKRMAEDGAAPTPMVDVNNVAGTVDYGQLKRGDTFSFEQEMHLRFDTMADGNGIEWIPLFTNQDELYKGATANITVNMPIQEIIESGLNSDRVAGVVINPFGQALTLPKEILKILVEHYMK